MLAVSLDKQRNAIDAKEQECNRIMKDSELAVQQAQIEVENRQKLDLALKKSLFTVLSIILENIFDRFADTKKERGTFGTKAGGRQLSESCSKGQIRIADNHQITS